MMVKPCLSIDIISLGIHLNTNFILKFVRTGGSVLLENAVLHLQKVLSTEEDDGKEQYMNSLVCTKHCNSSHLKLHLLQSIFVSISMWCDYKLQDYHSHFSQVSCKPSVTLLSILANDLLVTNLFFFWLSTHLHPNSSKARKYSLQI